MNVAVKVSLGLMTTRKRKRLDAVISRMRSCTRRYIDSLWESPGSLDKATLERINFPALGYNQKAACLRLALQLVVNTKKSAKATKQPCNKPKVPNHFPFSSLLCSIKPGRRSFDYVITIASLVPNERIVIPFQSHRVLNQWLAIPGAKICQGARICNDFAILTVKVPDDTNKNESRKVLAIDAGICKLLVDSEGNHYGTNTRDVLNSIRRKKPGSKGHVRARRTRTQFFNRIVKEIPFHRIGALAVEKLTNIKIGKRRNRGKSFRKLLAPWTIRQVFSRINFMAQLNRVRVVAVDPRNTSRTCPSCRNGASENRKGEKFECVGCGHRQDADEVGALNILEKALETLGSIWSPSFQNLIVTNS